MKKPRWKCPHCGRTFDRLDALSTEPVLPWHYNNDKTRDRECPGTHRPGIPGTHKEVNHDRARN